ncbi:uncharacterized protein LOC109535533 isoform X1 [Dendroctonus ponderosae]|uniref:uncharacterized protein LOC109535533 isoform X1 n=1 Tax=Dendroctonus ponderosae TaxID=77166 RepID=UPI002034AFFF|nr:uncharacterized protein LOC109535533 isoform X1 [Dendroctonus ponderosae]KAH1027184.1 hypothetical protein HUJ05_000741 [Dendroctonus ponderosae]
MDQFLGCYLDGFNGSARNSLHDRRNRKQMVDYINTLIQGCAGAANNDTEQTCKEAITTLLLHHDKTKNANGTVCMMGKYHNILYVAVKLCYLWQLQDAELVCKLLTGIYSCEQTFERIFIGAIFGTKAPHFIAGWKSDFDDQEENVRGVVYFLDKANKGKLMLPVFRNSLPENIRFLDIPIDSCAKASPVKLCIQLGLPDKLLIFLRFGAQITDLSDELSNFQYILNRLSEFNHCYPYNIVACLQILLRVVPTINISKAPISCDKTESILIREIVAETYNDLLEDGILPRSRCGFFPPELKHICRCAIRQQLWKNFALPAGIRQLPLPEKMWRYLDILDD